MYGRYLLHGALLCALWSVCSHARAARAAELPPLPLTLEQLLLDVEQRNPESRSAAARVRAAAERPAQARAFEDPSLSAELWQVPLGLQNVPLMFTLQQPLPWPGKLRARAAALEVEEKRAQAAADSTVRRLRLLACRAYYDYRLATRSLDLLQKSKQLLSALALSVEARFRVGRAELGEVLKAQEESARFDNELLDVEKQRQLAVVALNTLLDRPPAEPLGAPVTAPVPQNVAEVAALTERAFLQRPELREAQAAITQARARLAAAKMERAPDLAVWAGLMAMLRGGENTFTVGAKVSIPSFSLSRSSAAAREAQAQVVAEQAALAQAQAGVRGEVAQAVLELLTAQRHINLHEATLLPLGERMVETAQVGYKTGRTSLSLLLEAMRSLLDHRLEHERYLRDYGQRLAELQAAIGGGNP